MVRLAPIASSWGMDYRLMTTNQLYVFASLFYNIFTKRFFSFDYVVANHGILGNPNGLG
jgi:hypothetical protein